METTAGDETVPRELVVVQALVNTIDLEDNDDRLDSPEALRRFLADQGLLDASEPVGEDDLAMAVELREALRAMLRVNHGEALDPAALEVVNRAAAEGHCTHRDISIGDHADQAVALLDRQRTDVELGHQFRGLADRLIWLDQLHVTRHGFSDFHGRSPH